MATSNCGRPAFWQTRRRMRETYWPPGSPAARGWPRIGADPILAIGLSSSTSTSCARRKVLSYAPGGLCVEGRRRRPSRRRRAAVIEADAWARAARLAAAAGRAGEARIELEQAGRLFDRLQQTDADREIPHVRRIVPRRGRTCGGRSQAAVKRLEASAHLPGRSMRRWFGSVSTIFSGIHSGVPAGRTRRRQPTGKRST